MDFYSNYEPPNDYRNYLRHHGVKGMRWGIRHDKYRKGDKMRTDIKEDSSITKRVKNDYNNMTDQEFLAKYKVSKDRYRKRVNKYGDPYMNSPMAKLGKKISEKNKAKKEKYTTAYDRYSRLSDKQKKDFFKDAWTVNGKRIENPDDLKNVKVEVRPMDIAFRDNPSLTYDKIYKEMKVNMDSEDSSIYKEAENEWLRKHGYLN